MGTGRYGQQRRDHDWPRSSYSFAGEPAPAASTATLNDRELAELIDAMAEADAEGYGDGGELSDAEFNALMAAAEGDDMQHDAFTEFDAAFSARQQADADRQDAISAALVEDALHPATRAEDKIARIMHRAAQGVYDGRAPTSPPSRRVSRSCWPTVATARADP